MADICRRCNDAALARTGKHFVDIRPRFNVAVFDLRGILSSFGNNRRLRACAVLEQHPQVNARGHTSSRNGVSSHKAGRQSVLSARRGAAKLAMALPCLFAHRCPMFLEFWISESGNMLNM